MSAADELEKLHQLLAKGALTQEEFDAAKASILSGKRGGSSSAINDFRLSETDRWIGGVCGGIAQVSGVDAWVWRLLFVFGLAFGGVTLVVYLLLWIFVPRDTLNY